MIDLLVTCKLLGHAHRGSGCFTLHTCTHTYTYTYMYTHTCRGHAAPLPPPPTLDADRATRGPVQGTALARSELARMAVPPPAHSPHFTLPEAILERDGRDTMLPLRPVGGIHACAAGDLDGACALVASSSWQPLHAADKHGSTALHWAASGGHLAVVRWLVEGVGADIDARNKEKRTPLMFACKTGREDVAHFLLDAGADPTLRMKDDSTAFDWAVLSGHLPTMELLAGHPRVDMTALNRFGCAAVQWAAKEGNIQTLRWLQSKGLSLSHVNGAKYGAVAKAAWRGHADAVRWLLFAPDGPRLEEQLDLLDLQGDNVANVARRSGQHDVADWLQRLIDARRVDGTVGCVEPEVELSGCEEPSQPLGLARGLGRECVS